MVLSESLKMIIVDEADLLLSFGFEEDIKKIAKHLPKICQGFLASATLSEEVDTIKNLILHNPVILTIQESQADLLTQFVARIKEQDKYLLQYVLIKLNLMTGKSIIFVNSIDKCFKLKLFLERFSIKTAVLNAELPQNSRFHIIQEFNKGLFNVLIATDKNDEEEKTTEEPKKKGKVSADEEYGVSRGIDFKDVKNIVNFDFPTSIRSYIHRVGRTARANRLGVSLSFVTDKDETLFKEVEQNQMDEGKTIKPYAFKMSLLDSFRYRVEDIMRGITRTAVREARYLEIKKEILNSEKLKSFFEENPDDLETLKHDKILQASRVLNHLKHIPKYLLPSAKKEEIAQPLTTKELDEQYYEHYGFKQKNRKRKAQSSNPLTNFEYGSQPSMRNTRRKFKKRK